MRYPKLVPAWVCTTPITVYIESEGLTADGEPEATELEGLMCNWQDGGEVFLSEEQRTVHIAGRAYFDGDICPDIPNITAGYGVVHGENRDILRGFKRRNPDGTVNHTEIEFR